MQAKERVVVGMSGGVDSSVAAARLARKGYDVVGITLKTWPQDCSFAVQDKCCGPRAVEDARHVATVLGIPHYVVDASRDFQEKVVDYFVSEYRTGRTPNPCVVCNEKLKFVHLIQKALDLGAKWVATGHYARVEQTKNGAVLHRARDQRKDQSYFLFTLSQKQLSRLILPLGGMTKAETRAFARELKLRIHDKDESQDVCFVPDNDYAGFLKTRLGRAGLQPGEIVHQDGRVLGHHGGIELYTIGQRKGINVGSSTPLYVVDIDPTSRRVVVGDNHDLRRDEFWAELSCWGPAGIPPDGTKIMVKIRYNHAGAMAFLHPRKGGFVRVCLEKAQRAVTPGQAAVFYRDDAVVGGGWISKEPPD